MLEPEKANEEQQRPSACKNKEMNFLKMRLLGWTLIQHSCCCCITSVVSDSVRPQRQQPTRLPRPWDPPGKNTGVGCHFLLQCMKVKVKTLSRVRLLVTPWTAAYQAPLSIGLPRQEYWSGLPFVTAGDFPNPGIKPLSFMSPELTGRFLTIVPPGKPAYSRLINSKLVNAY